MWFEYLMKLFCSRKYWGDIILEKINANGNTDMKWIKRVPSENTVHFLIVPKSETAT